MGRTRGNVPKIAVLNLYSSCVVFPSLLKHWLLSHSLSFMYVCDVHLAYQDYVNDARSRADYGKWRRIYIPQLNIQRSIQILKTSASLMVIVGSSF
jgi:hypothetical protein